MFVKEVIDGAKSIIDQISFHQKPNVVTQSTFMELIPDSVDSGLK